MTDATNPSAKTGGGVRRVSEDEMRYIEAEIRFCRKAEKLGIRRVMDVSFETIEALSHTVCELQAQVDSYTHPHPSLSVGLDRARVESAVRGSIVMTEGGTCVDVKKLTIALSAPAEGYVLVPVEPTEAMLDAAQSKIERAQKQGWAGLGPLSIYRAMIAACISAVPIGETL